MHDGDVLPTPLIASNFKRLVPTFSLLFFILHEEESFPYFSFSPISSFFVTIYFLFAEGVFSIVFHCVAGNFILVGRRNS